MMSRKKGRLQYQDIVIVEVRRLRRCLFGEIASVFSGFEFLSIFMERLKR
jgi:hypothetical protein